MRLGSHAVRLPVETLHTAHVFTEMNRGLYSGMNRTAKDGGWKNHLLGALDGETRTMVNYFQRLEYQDGKRKLPTLRVGPMHTCCSHDEMRLDAGGNSARDACAQNFGFVSVIVVRKEIPHFKGPKTISQYEFPPLLPRNPIHSLRPMY